MTGRYLEPLLFNSEIDLILTSYANCVIPSNAAPNQATTFAITGTRL